MKLEYWFKKEGLVKIFTKFFQFCSRNQPSMKMVTWHEVKMDSYLKYFKERPAHPPLNKSYRCIFTPIIDWWNSIRYYICIKIPFKFFSYLLFCNVAIRTWSELFTDWLMRALQSSSSRKGHCCFFSVISSHCQEITSTNSLRE